MAINKEIDLRFVIGYTPLEFRDALHMLADGKVDPRPLITGTVGLDGVEGAFDALGDPEAPREDPDRPEGLGEAVVGEREAAAAPDDLERGHGPQRHVAVGVEVVAVGQRAARLPEHLAVAAAQHLREVARVGLGADLDERRAASRARDVRQRTTWRACVSIRLKYDEPL